MKNQIPEYQSWSNSFLEPYQKFKARYALEMLHSLGTVFDHKYLNNTSLQTTMMSLAEQDENNFYKLARIAYEHLQKNESFDLTNIFNEDQFEHCTLDLSKPDEDLYVNNHFFYEVSVVYITPLCTKVMPCERIVGNRVLRHPDFTDINDFCLVYFKPENEDEYVKSNLHYEMTLRNGILLCNKRYHLFGASNSQLGQHSYWFIRANSHKEVDEKRTKLGDFSGITNVGKYVTRLGLWFSKTMPSKIILNYTDDLDQRGQHGDYCVTMIDDIKRNGYCFTDGNGLISKGLAKLIAKNLGYPTEHLDLDIYPSAYQIRMAGCKGLVIVEPQSTLDQFYIKIRPSMKKFESNDWTLDVCEFSQPVPTRLNNQIITLMSDLGVPDEKFLDLQQKWFQDDRHAPDLLIDLWKNRIPLPVNECRYIFGCAFESSLRPGTCFIRYQVVDDDGQPLRNPRFETILGRVTVTKNPCLYAGDMLELEAVDCPELYCLTDVIVFSTQDDRPDPNKISGSDLDGDHYFIYWGSDLKLSRTKSEPLDYSSYVSNQPPKSTPITHVDILRHCFSLFNASSFGEIYNLHTIVVDKNLENCERRTCQKLAVELAHMFSAAIDASKTGYVADRQRINQIRRLAGRLYPDFLRKDRSYKSQSIVGKLYRQALKYKNANPDKFRNHAADSTTNTIINSRKKSTDSYADFDSGLAINLRIISEGFTTMKYLKAPGAKTPAICFKVYTRNSKNVKSTEQCATETPNNQLAWINFAQGLQISYSCIIFACLFVFGSIFVVLNNLFQTQRNG